MDKPCEIEDLTADGAIHGSIFEYELGKFGTNWRSPYIESLHCSNCGADFEAETTTQSMDETISEHVKKSVLETNR